MLNNDQIIAGLYDSILEPELRPEAISNMATALNCSGLLELIFNPVSKTVISQLSINLPEQVAEEYDGYYATVCPRMNYVNTHPNYGVLYDYLHCDEREIDHDEFYNWMGQFEYRYYLAIQMFGGRSISGGLAFQRSRNDGHATNEDITLATYFQPHIQRSAEIQDLIGGLELRAASAESALERLAFGVLMLDSFCRIQFLNKAAQTILEQSDGVSTHQYRLIQTEPPLGPTLSDSFDQIRLGHARSTLAQIRRASNKPPLQVLIYRVSPRTRTGLVRKAAFILCLFDPVSKPADLKQHLVKLYSLTTAEAILVEALLSNQTLAEYAERRAIALETARWRLKQVMSKVDVHSQSELVSVLLSGICQLSSQELS